MNDKNLLSQSGSRAPELHDAGLRAGSLLEGSLSRLNEEQARNLMAEAAKEALRLEAKSREQNIDYAHGKKATEDHIDAFNMIDRSGKFTRHNITSDIKTGAGKMTIESKSGATCFVASVAYGDPNHPDVMFLRWYRDEILSKSKSGLAFIEWYWRYGPKLARFVEGRLFLRKMSKLFISMIVNVLKKFEN